MRNVLILSLGSQLVLEQKTVDPARKLEHFAIPANETVSDKPNFLQILFKNMGIFIFRKRRLLWRT